MKTAVILAGAVALAQAKPHGHQHIHPLHKKAPAAVTVAEAVATAFAYVLNGETISQQDVCDGIASGDLTWEGTEPADACKSASSVVVSSTAAASSTATPTTAATTSSTEAASSSSAAPASTSSTSAAAAEFFQKSSSTAAASSSEAAATTTSSSAAASSTAASTSSSSSTSSDLTNIVSFVSSLAQDSYPDFPDGEISCDTFPSEYGAIPVHYLSMNGWTGIQNLNSAGDDIESDGTSCSDNSLCSYSCAPGWQKLQWPSSQPSNGASMGGLKCSGGKLYKTSSSDQLCGQGNGLVYVENKSGSAVSVCRTDYPGNEAENVPLDIATGTTEPLTCPIEEDYYKHEGSDTSAQYYINPLGVAADPGCSWDGDGNGDSGNSAPIVLGVGELDGTTWLSIQQNSPTYMGAFSGTVEITGDGLSATCKYSNGEYCGANGCTSHTVDGAGCTVATTGKATFVVSSS